MDRLVSQWKILAATTALAGIAIFVLKMDYNDLQMADDVDVFRSVLGEDQGRATAAALADMIFAAGYGLLGMIVFRQVASGALALAGTAAAVGASLADEVENVLVLVNVNRADSTTDGWISAMTTVGVIKWTLLGIMFALLIVVLVRRRREPSTT